MAQQTINLGTTANDGTGDTLRDAGGKINANFDELFAMALPYVTGRWYPAVPGNALTLASGAAMASTVTRMVPFTVRQPITVTDLGARVTTLSAGGLFRLGIYATNPATLKPTGNPLASVGGLSTAATGAVSGSVTPVALVPGVLYWAAIQVDNGTAAFQANSAALATASLLVGDPSLAAASSGAATGLSGFTVSVGYASGLPDMTAQTISGVNTAQNALLWVKAQ